MSMPPSSGEKLIRNSRDASHVAFARARRNRIINFLIQVILITTSTTTAYSNNVFYSRARLSNLDPTWDSTHQQSISRKSEILLYRATSFGRHLENHFSQFWADQDSPNFNLARNYKLITFSKQFDFPSFSVFSISRRVLPMRSPCNHFPREVL